MGKLTVFLDKVNNLKDKDTFSSSDPYVKFELKEEKFGRDKTYGKHRSTKKKNDPSPVYGETYVFNDVPSLHHLTLKVVVMDDDLIRDDKLGACKIKVGELGLSSRPMPIERSVDNKMFSKDAKIHLRLSWTD